MYEWQYCAVDTNAQKYFPWTSQRRQAIRDLLDWVWDQPNRVRGERVAHIAVKDCYVERRWTDQGDPEGDPEGSVGEAMWYAQYHGWVDRQGRWVDPQDPPGHKDSLWLDDGRAPSEWERGLSCSQEDRDASEWVWVMTIDEAKTALQSGRYRYVSLDWSLESTDPDHTGTDLAKWILQEAEAGRLPRLKWYVHSGLSSGRAEMRPYLKAADQSWAAREKVQNHDAK
jgi:hypothetical protein